MHFALFRTAPGRRHYVVIGSGDHAQVTVTFAPTTGAGHAEQPTVRLVDGIAS